MAEKIKIQVISGLGGACLGVNGTRVSGPKPAGPTLYEFWVDAPRLFAALPRAPGEKGKEEGL